ncbi:sulfurtransferase [Actomonas aquatica]|uniref:Sulfurtransferase n=1 Tax=Actomonas aquatica TaxID=2866162 RepID=A0ABZ1C6U9_9BACT|nr:sulfurtransferase [Opitutus sp. WL0086]WRQ87181.1 sulfurtransferase [Opitutus sp. WL0086]
MLISTSALETRLSDSSVVIFDCRHDLGDPAAGRAMFDAGHIPGAQFAGVDTVLAGALTGSNGRHPLPSAEAFVAFLEQAGVTADTLVVGYDQVGGQYAARLWWMLRWIGHPQAAVLDGGWNRWTAEGRATSTDDRAATPGRVAAAVDDALWVDADMVAGGGGLVVDARAPERYRGEVEPIDPVAGHIPGAVNRFFKTNLRDDLTFRDPAELRAEWLALLDGREPSEVIHQCGSGISACANLLAMEVAGLTGSRLYVGSWSEWVADPLRPVGTIKG